LQAQELASIASLQVVRTKACRKNPVNTVDYLGLSIGADLKELVMIRVFQSFPQKKRFFCFRISRVLPGATAIMMLAILSQIDESVIHSEHWA